MTPVPLEQRLRGRFAGRGFMLFPLAAFAVHQLRYELAYGSRSGAELTAQGHGYLNSLAPWAVALATVGVGLFLMRVARAAAGRVGSGPRRAFGELWALASVCLLSTYTAQEWLEGVFAAGHPGGISGIFGHGGWWAIALSVAIGLVVAGLLRLGSTVLEAVTPVVAPLRLVARTLLAPLSVSLPRRAPLAGASAGRAPPRMRLTA